ncbi:MAG: hypothetical protein MUE49_06540 [Rhodospirillales bacterium]|nr:hypothetical protein [Rhodospirillales bacterium]
MAKRALTLRRVIALFALAGLPGCAWLQPAWLMPDAACGSTAARAKIAAGRQEAAQVPITISSGEFQPMVIDLRHGRLYRLVIDNRDDETRIFYAPGFLRSAQIGGIYVGGSPADDDCPGQLLVPARTTAEITVKPARRGHFSLANSLLPLDAWGAGLGAIHVE